MNTIHRDHTLSMNTNEFGVNNLAYFTLAPTVSSSFRKRIFGEDESFGINLSFRNIELNELI